MGTGSESEVFTWESRTEAREDTELSVGDGAVASGMEEDRGGVEEEPPRPRAPRLATASQNYTLRILPLFSIYHNQLFGFSGIF